MRVKAFLAPTRRAAALQISPWGEVQAGNRNLLQHLCSLRWGRSAADEALDCPGQPLFSRLCWGRDAASAPAAAASPARALAGTLDLILNIYWTFGLMPITWKVSYMMGIKAKAKFFARGWPAKKQSLTVRCWEHSSPAVLQAFPSE